MLPTALMVAEKPSIALSIATILSSRQMNTRRSFLEVYEFDGNFRGSNVRCKVTSLIVHGLSIDTQTQYQNRGKTETFDLSETPTTKLRASPKVLVSKNLLRESSESPFCVRSYEQNSTSLNSSRRWDPEIGDFVDEEEEHQSSAAGGLVKSQAEAYEEKIEECTSSTSDVKKEANPNRRTIRFQPLGIERLYGRTRPTRIYGVLNARGEVPGTDLAPVPKRYRDRCEDQKGWSIREVVTKVLELNHWDDIDAILNDWVGRYNRRNFPPLIKAITSTGALNHSVRVFTWIKNQRCYRARNDIYNSMIWLYARHQRVDRARALFSEMQEWRLVM